MKRYSLVVLVAALGLVLAAPAAGSTDIHSPKAPIKTMMSPKAQVSKKKKCKKGQKLKKGKCVKKKKPPPPPPAPLPLSEGEVKTQVNNKAYQYCLVDPYCYDYGVYVEYPGGPLACASKTTYQWACYGGNLEDDGLNFYTCDFREIVERDGFSGIKSHQDLSFGLSGWDCY